MFSGNNTVEYPTQWALNPGAYQNVSNEQVDWAALAQQWIQMKESCPATPAASTTPTSSATSSSTSQPSSQPSQASQPSQPSPALLPVAVGEEGGEAPMEVEGNESDIPPAPIVSPQQWKSANDSSSWGNSWEQWGNSNRPDWGWQSNSSSKTSQLPGDAPCVGTYSANDSNYSGYSSGNQTNYRPGYWSTDDTAETSTGNIPLNDNLEGSRGARRTFRQPLHTTAPEVDTTQTIDAAKRRQLPAWIREGLEKMEREKQKQVEREKDKKDREELLKHKKLEDETPQTKSDDSVPKMPTKSKFDTDSDNSEGEEKNSKSKKEPQRDRIAAPPPIIRSKEEIMQEIMLCVRRSLTEILLEVTNEQILSVCQEELSRKRSQPQATHGASMASKSQALSSIGGQLGLGIYENSSGDSNSENESEDGRRSSTPGEKRRKAADISDGQLQDSIKRRKAEFEKTTRDIEAQIALDEMGNNKNDHKALTGDRSSKGARGMGDSESDGEDSTTHIRNEQNNIKQKKNLEGTPPLDSIKKSLTDASAEKFARASKSRHSEGGNKSLDTNHKDRSSGKYGSKRDKNDKYKKRKGGKNEFRDESSARSTDSDSESDSSTKKSDYSGGKRSASTSDSSSNTSSNSSYTSDSSVRNSKKRAKKKESSDDSNRSKRSKKDKTKSKNKKDKRSKHSKRSVKSGHAANSKTDNMESHKKSVDYKEDRLSRDSSVRKSYTRTPERKSYKSRYSERSRSRSDDRRSHHTHESHDRYYGSSARDKYKVKDRRDRSRDDRERLRDDKDWHRDDRGRSRDRKERRDRDKRSDRDYRNSRSNRY